jgi:hypothetical protein
MMSKKYNNIVEHTEELCDFVITLVAFILPFYIIFFMFGVMGIVFLQEIFGPATGYHILLPFWSSLTIISIFIIRARKKYFKEDIIFKTFYTLIGLYNLFHTLKKLNDYIVSGEIKPLIDPSTVNNVYGFGEKIIVVLIIIAILFLMIEGMIHIWYTWGK